MESKRVNISGLVSVHTELVYVAMENMAAQVETNIKYNGDVNVILYPSIGDWGDCDPEVTVNFSKWSMALKIDFISRLRRHVDYKLENESDEAERLDMKTQLLNLALQITKEAERLV